MTQLEEAAEIVWTECMGVKEGETVLVIYDDPLKNVGKALNKKAVALQFHSQLLEMEPLTVHGEEPPQYVAEAMKEKDVVVIPTSKSLSHTKARKEASANGVRIATLPGVTEDIMKRTIDVDYQTIKNRSETIAAILSDADTAVITTEKGTNLKISLKGREALADFGIYHEKGDFGNLPAGEAYIAPLEGKSEGTLVVDGAIAGIGKLEDEVTIIVDKGLAVDIQNCPELVTVLDTHSKNAKNIAELGVGTNDKAHVVGNVLEDEKVMGTVHVALGNNVFFGGNVNVPVHLDCIILDPTLVVDSTPIIEKGKLLI